MIYSLLNSLYCEREDKMATFTPRLENDCPPASDKHWIGTAFGGYNKCNTDVDTRHGGTLVLPNCTGWAWGRFHEILGKVPTLRPGGNANTWYSYTQDGYKRGTKPQVGAVICWSGGDMGHVAIVEKVNSDGSIITSNSSYKDYNNYYFMMTLYPKNNYSAWNGSYTLQGFIYNPACDGISDALSDFLKVASDHVGEDNKWVCKKTGITKNQSWSAAFVIACAKSVNNALNKVIPEQLNPADIARQGVKKGYGKWYKGPYHKCNPTPQPGDLVLLKFSLPKSAASSPLQSFLPSTTSRPTLSPIDLTTDMYESDKIAIVKSVKSGNIQVVEGDVGGKISYKKYAMKSTVIVGYYRPDWSKLDASPVNLATTELSGPLYDMVNTRQDAVIREFGYVDSNNKPSISPSNIRLSVINYTTLLGSLFSWLGGTTSADTVSGSHSVSGLDTVPRAIAEYLLDKGLNAAAVSGVLGNIKVESGNFNVGAVGDYGTSFGICQWHYGRGEAMKKMAGSDWKNNLTGQLDYLWHELSHGYSSVLSALKAVPNTEAGARKAADVFVRQFEIPADIEGESVKRQANASDFWKAMKVEAVGATSSRLSGGKTYNIPTTLSQTGIDRIYTNYTYFYNIWASSTTQKKLAQIWDKQGRPSSRGIATISGYYLVAVTPTYGLPGDLITVVLKDNVAFDALIADAKSPSDANCNKWGHETGGKTNIIEWEIKGSAASNVDNKAMNSMNLSGWEGKAISKIINRGKYKG